MWHVFSNTMLPGLHSCWSPSFRSSFTIWLHLVEATLWNDLERPDLLQTKIWNGRWWFLTVVSTCSSVFSFKVGVSCQVRWCCSDKGCVCSALWSVWSGKVGFCSRSFDSSIIFDSPSFVIRPSLLKFHPTRNSFHTLQIPSGFTRLAGYSASEPEQSPLLLARYSHFTSRIL